jgi:hypothetical protein
MAHFDELSFIVSVQAVIPLLLLFTLQRGPQALLRYTLKGALPTDFAKPLPF